MVSCTLMQYKESFHSNLVDFLNEYQDNTKTFFLQNEKTKYQAYHNALTKIVDQMKLFTRDELNQNLVHRSIAADLKLIDQNIYNSIITELNPVQSEVILSLSAAKKDRIKIDETALENHVKSSIVILKFISEEFEIPLDLKQKSLSKDNDFNLDIINKDLDVWLKTNESKIDYFTFPMSIEEKADYVIDSYKNYEERNFKYQIDICNSILKKNSNEKIIIDYKRNFEKKLIELREQYPIPNKNIDVIISDINNAFFRLEKFMEGSVSIYQSFLFNDAFTLFFNELNKIENITVKNHDLRDGYLYFISELYYAYDKSEFRNQDAYENEDFNRDCNELFYLRDHRSSEFGINVDLDDYHFKMTSIVDIIKPTTNKSPEIININFEDTLSVADGENKYPRIFTSSTAYNKFINLKDEFDNTKENLANYSFVYHRMIKDKFIYEDYKQTEFVYFLLNFDINISRIKPKNQLGNIDNKERIYNSVK
jgi:hypothetical protein